MASRLFAVDLDLGLNKAKRFVFEDFATNPDTNLAGGRVIFWTANDSDDNHLKVYNGGSWEVLAYKSDLSDSNTTYAISSETVSGGANLRLTGSDASTDNVTVAGSGATTVTRTDANTITISSTDTDTNTTYAISAETTTGGANLRLTDSGAVTDDVKLAGAGAVAVTRTDANTITITGTDTNTTYDLNVAGTTAPTLTLAGNNSTNDIVTFASGTGISLGQAAGTITITNTVADTNTTYDLTSTGTTTASINLVPSSGGTDSITITGSGATSVSHTAGAITVSSTNTTYNTATSTVQGLIKLFSDTSQTVAANAVSATASRTYGIQLNASGQSVVNVPWVDTDTNTTYSAGTGIQLSGTTFSNTGVLSITGTSNEVEVSASTGAITIGLPNDVTIGGGLTVTGDLTVNGNTTTLNTATLSVEDNIILLNNGVTGTPSLNAGLEVERGTSTNASITWNESTDAWTAGLAGAEITLARKYAVNLSAANETSAGVFSIAHGLATKDVFVNVYSLTSPYASVECQIEHTSTSAVTVTFNTDPGDDTYRVVVTG